MIISLIGGLAMKVLIYKWKVFNQEDIAEAFFDYGYEVIEYEEPSVYLDEAKGLKFHDNNELTNIIKGVDMVFSFNYFAHISDICNKLGIIYISYTVDSPLISLYHNSIYNPCNYIFVFDKFFYYQLKELELEHLFYLPLGANAKRIESQLEKSNIPSCLDIKDYKYDLSFVGGMYHRNSYDNIKDKLDEDLKNLFNAVLKEQLFSPGMDIIDNSLSVELLTKLLEITDFKQSEGSFSDILTVFTNTFLGFKLANIERVVILNALAAALKNYGYKVDLFTDDTDNNLENVILHNTVDYNTEMPEIFRQSKINLNISLRNIRTGIPLRVWDVLASGGFLLTNKQIELEDYFKIGEDLVVFESIDEAVTKSLYYLEHEKERKEIARSGFERVKKYHSYRQRIGDILDCIAGNKE